MSSFSWRHVLYAGNGPVHFMSILDVPYLASLGLMILRRPPFLRLVQYPPFSTASSDGRRGRPRYSVYTLEYGGYHPIHRIQDPPCLAPPTGQSCTRCIGSSRPRLDHHKKRSTDSDRLGGRGTSVPHVPVSCSHQLRSNTPAISTHMP